MAADVNVFLDPFNGTHVSILDCSVPIKLTHKWSVKTSTLTRANSVLREVKGIKDNPRCLCSTVNTLVNSPPAHFVQVLF